MATDHAAIRRLLSWDGVGRAIEHRIELYEDVVRANAPYSFNATGIHLVDSIGHTKEHVPEGLMARVGTHPSEHIRGYAIIVHRGSVPHTILPRPPRKSLRFKVAGRIVIVNRVNHPGTTPDPFLTRWLEDLVR